VSERLVIILRYPQRILPLARGASAGILNPHRLLLREERRLLPGGFGANEPHTPEHQDDYRQKGRDDNDWVRPMLVPEGARADVLAAGEAGFLALGHDLAAV